MKEKIKEWFKKNWIFISIFCFAIITRLYYFILIGDQPLWWDEADYLSIARHWAFDMPYEVTPHRPPILPLFSAFIFKIGLSILSIKFFLVVLPSIGIVLISYILISKYINKKVALVTSMMLSVSWVILFNSFRVHVDVLLTFITLLTIFVFLEGYTKRSTKLMIFAGILLGLTFLSKFSSFLLVLALFIFVLPKLFKRKEVFFFFFSTFLVLLVFLLYSNLAFGSMFTPFVSGSHLLQAATGEASIPEFFKEIRWSDFQRFESMLLWPFFIFFLIGIPAFFKFTLYLDKVLKNPNKEESFKIILTLFLVFGIIFFIFIQRYMEPRLILPISLTLFIISAEGIVWTYEKIKEKQKIIAVIFVILIMFIGSFAQLSFADEIIQLKKDSYDQVRDAGIWLKSNTPSDSIIFSTSRTQTSLYSEREVIYLSRYNRSGMDELIEKDNYLMISIYEQNPEWMSSWIEENQNRLEVMQVYYIDDQQASLIIYKLK